MTTKDLHTCEFECDKPATVYGGDNIAGGWAGYACDYHAEHCDWFNIWDRLDYTPPKLAEKF